MNTFANSLFSVLFGWARGLIQQIWNAALSGQFSAFLTWLGDHWLAVVFGLILGCTVMDYLIWLIRWRPYLLWRSFFRRASRFFRRENKQFEQGYQSSVGIQLPPDQEAAPRTEEAWSEEAWGQPPVEEAPAPEPKPVFSPPQEREPRPRQFTPPQVYEAPPLYAAARQVTGSFSAELPVARRRRSEKYERRRKEWRERLINGDAQDDEILDGLPPAVDRQQAFHEPVYPRRNTDRDNLYSSWQRPDDGENRTNG